MPLDSALCSEIIITLGTVPLAHYETPGTPELAQALAPLVGEHDAILMANHGVVTFGEDLLTAYMNMETVEHYAKIALVTHMLGKQKPLSDTHVSKLREIRLKYHAQNHVGAGRRDD
jgi:L-fuculose-phosphate aldolase